MAAEVKALPDKSEKSSPVQGAFNRFANIPLVKSLFGQVSGVYDRTKNKNFVTKLGFGAAEYSVRAAVVTTKLTYTAIPTSLKNGLEQGASKMDSLACGGLKYLQTKLPVINTETAKIIAAGTERVEQSEVVEVLLTITEAAVDYVKPAKENPPAKEMDDSLAVIQTKMDRIRCITSTVVDGGIKVLWYAVSVPSKVTKAGLNNAKKAAQWSWGATQNILDRLPGNSKHKQELRRSKRFKAKGDYHRIIDASAPFPVSPERKRKYNKEDGDGTIEELIYVNKDYVSEEDPDYVPEEGEEEESESSDGYDTGEKGEVESEKDKTKAKVEGCPKTKDEASAKNGAVKGSDGRKDVGSSGMNGTAEENLKVLTAKDGVDGAMKKENQVENLGPKGVQTIKESANRTEVRIML